MGKKCMVEVRYQEVLSPVCSIVRHQAAALDKIHGTIEAPKIWSRSSILSLLDGVFETLLIGNIETEKVISGTEGTLIVEARADRTSQVVTFGKVITPTRKIVMKNLRLLGYPSFILPATVLRTPIEVAALKLTTNSIPSTCRVEPSFVRTFDNVTSVTRSMTVSMSFFWTDPSTSQLLSPPGLETQKKIVKI